MQVRFQISNSRFQMRRRSGGFTFLEVLFAIIVLGVGFIMVAAMFPAALKQTQAAVEDATASALWVNASRKFTELARQRVPGQTNPPQYYLDNVMDPDGDADPNNPDSIVHWFFDSRYPLAKRKQLWEFARANILFEEDPRFAVVPLFRREVDNNSTSPNHGAAEAQLYLIAVRCRSHVQFDASDLKNGGLDPLLIDVSVNPPDPANSDPASPWIGFNSGNAADFNALGPGAYVVISDATQPPGIKTKIKNGQIYRLGQQLSPTSVGSYYIAPDSAGANDVYQTNFNKPYGAKALVVGRGINPATNEYEGGVQALSIVPVPLKLK
jgi:type II secretory pathway pseudopilin PulG